MRYVFSSLVTWSDLSNNTEKEEKYPRLFAVTNAERQSSKHVACQKGKRKKSRWNYTLACLLCLLL